MYNSNSDIDIRGVKRCDGLASGGGYNLVVDEEAGGLLVAVPVGGDDINEEIHFVELNSFQKFQLSRRVGYDIGHSSNEVKPLRASPSDIFSANVSDISG